MQVSVIIPAFNAEAWLERAFASVLAQGITDYEVIIVDNNSTDGTVALMEVLRSKCPSLVRLTNAKRQGSAAARNQGVSLARGEWIQFLDADDVLLPGKLARQLALVTAATEWVIGACIRRDVEGNETISTLNEDPWKGLVHNGGVGHTNSNLIRISLYRKVGGQNEALPNGVDTDLYFRLLQAEAKVILDPAPGAVYLDREGYRLSTLPGSTSRQRMIHLIGRVIAYLQGHRPYYFKQEEAFYRAALLNAIRILATHHLGEAKKCYQQYFPSGIMAVELDYSIIPTFTKLYPLIGFGLTEFLRLQLRYIFPARLKNIIKGK